MTPTIDTAISAWKAATTDAERDAAAAAIEEHVAHDTPEGADYVAATDELLARLKAEFGPVPAKPARDGTTYSAEALRVLEGMAPPRRPAGRPCRGPPRSRKARPHAGGAGRRAGG